MTLKGKLDEAVARFRKAIDVDPKYAQAHCNLGTTLALEGKVEEAIACYRKALELDPNCEPARTNLAWLLATAGTLMSEK